MLQLRESVPEPVDAQKIEALPLSIEPQPQPPSSYRVFIATEVDPLGGQPHSGSNASPDEPEVANDDPTPWISEFLEDARSHIGKEPARLVRRAGQAWIMASCGFLTATAGLAMSQTPLIIGGAVVSGLSLLCSGLATVLLDRTLPTAHTRKSEIYFKLSNNLQRAATRFRSLKIAECRTALLEKARHFQAYLILGEKLHHDAREIELAAINRRRLAVLLTVIGMGVAITVAMFGPAVTSNRQYEWFATAGAFAALLITGLLSSRLVGTALAFMNEPPPLNATALDPFPDIADWCDVILKQLSEYLTVYRRRD